MTTLLFTRRLLLWYCGNAPRRNLIQRQAISAGSYYVNISKGNLVSAAFQTNYEEAAWALAEQQPEDKSYEVRQYKPAYWVAMKVKGTSYKDTGSQAFRNLFNYITGQNQNKQNIAMTIPVSAKELEIENDPNAREYSFAFYLPKEFQENPPEPSNPCVFLEKRPEQTFYVRTFGGRPDDAAVKQHEESLYADLERNGVNLSQVDKKSMIFAQYQSPFKLFNRRNEIWVAAKSS